MEESATEAQKREETLRMYHSCKEALRIINDATMASVGGDGTPMIGGGGGPVLPNFRSVLFFTLKMIYFVKFNIFFRLVRFYFSI
jgi:hypothetical protein